MSAYYIAINRTKRERIEPGSIGGGAVKLSAMTYGEAGRVLAYLMATRWRTDRVEVVSDEDYDSGSSEALDIGSFADVTMDAVRTWNANRPEYERPILYREDPTSAT